LEKSLNVEKVLKEKELKKKENHNPLSPLPFGLSGPLLPAGLLSPAGPTFPSPNSP
jgi:hypothetical protein